MNAIEIADTLEETYGYPTQASDMLRRQHEAILKLREALVACSEMVGAGIFEKYCGRALKDTEEIAK